MIKLTTYALFASAMMAASSAAAQDMDALTTLQEACMADAQKYCAEEIANPEAVMQCLVNNAEKLSDECKAPVEGMAKALGITPSVDEKSGEKDSAS